ncbi:MAG: hypothetical protein ACYCYO_04645 [Bacilli bacterium]
MNSNINTLRYLHESAIDDLVDTYEKRGCIVIRNPEVAGQTLDLLVKEPDGRQIFFEVRVRGSLNEKKHLSDAKKYIESIPNASLRLRLVSPPRDISVEVDGIDKILFDMIIGQTPDELKELGPNVAINDVSGIEIEDANISPFGSIFKGKCTIEVSEGSGLESEENFKAEFELFLDQAYRAELRKIHVDTSPWYE